MRTIIKKTIQECGPMRSLLIVLTLSVPLPALAQGEPTPTPDAPPVTPTPEASATPVATPVATPLATPIATPVATPTEPTAAPDPGHSGVDPLRGLQEDRFRRARKTSIGGYGELHLNAVEPFTNESKAEVDFHRLVVFLAHQFSPHFRFYGELEVEHALVKAGAPGEVGLEQAYIDYAVLGDVAGVRAGIVLVPMGVINQWHEPPIFNGVERPLVDKVVIPTTWREAAVGIFGSPIEGLRYELYVMSGLDASGFSAKSGLRGGRQGIAEARTNGLAAAARIEYEPVLGVLAGVSGYYGFSGQNAELFDLAGNELELDVPVAGVVIDARANWQGIEARALYATIQIDQTSALRNAYDDSGNPLNLDIGSQISGLYVEAGYNVLRFLETEQALVPFIRYQRHDTLAAVEGRAPVLGDEPFGVNTIVTGITWRPLNAIAVKADYEYTDPDGSTEPTHTWNGGIGFMF